MRTPLVMLDATVLPNIYPVTGRDGKNWPISKLDCTTTDGARDLVLVRTTFPEIASLNNSTNRIDPCTPADFAGGVTSYPRAVFVAIEAYAMCLLRQNKVSQNPSMQIGFMSAIPGPSAGFRNAFARRLFPALHAATTQFLEAGLIGGPEIVEELDRVKQCVLKLMHPDQAAWTVKGLDNWRATWQQHSSPNESMTDGFPALVSFTIVELHMCIELR